MAIGFAGGGNRCYWQGGFWEAFNGLIPQKPDYFVALSAGAYQCCFNIIGKGQEVRGRAFAIADELNDNLDWSRLKEGRSPFVVGKMFREFLAEVFDEQALAALQQAPEICIQFSHPLSWMPASLAAFGAISAYQIEKLVTGGTYSQAGRYLGLSPSWLSTHAIKTPAELVDALMATSSVPPFMPVGQVNGRVALDGGLVDNPPTLLLSKTEAQGGRTLILSTRFGRRLPSSGLRTVVGPSQDLKVDKFAINDAAGLKEAYHLGLKDGEAFAEALRTS